MAQWQQTMQELNDAWWLKYQTWRGTSRFRPARRSTSSAWLCIGRVGMDSLGLFRSVGTRPAVPIMERPPTCEFCGYNLTGTAIDGRCPECGTGDRVPRSGHPPGNRLGSRRRLTGMVAMQHRCRIPSREARAPYPGHDPASRISVVLLVADSLDRFCRRGCRAGRLRACLAVQSADI